LGKKVVLIRRSRMSRCGKWEKIENDADYKGSGVYKIALFNSNNSPVEIARFLDNDKDGILGIGSSKDMERRLRYFRGAMEGKKYSHAEGKRLGMIKKSAKFVNRYKNCQIQYCFRKLTDVTGAKKEERRFLECYFKKYGESPPLNRRLA